MTIIPSDDPQVVIADEVLAGRLRSGESAAGDELVRRHGPMLLRYLQRLTGSAALAEDLHQQTWLSVLEHLDRFDSRSGPGGFRAWLFRIATNKVQDLWRSRGRERKATEGLSLVVEEEESGGPAADIEAGEMHGKVQQAIARLPEAQKQVVCMRYYANMKFVEIAQTLGCPLNTALGRMHKALLRLRKLMEE